MLRIRFESFILAVYGLLLALSLVGPFSTVRVSERVFTLQLCLIAILLAVGSVRLLPFESQHLRQTIKFGFAAFAAVVLWIAFQLLPISLVSSSLWTSASTALGRPLRPSISIDPHATILVFFQVIFYGGVFLLSAYNSINRTTAHYNSIIILMLSLLSAFLFYIALPDTHNNITVFCFFLALSAIMLVGFAYLLFERSETRSQDRTFARNIFIASAFALTCAASLYAVVFYKSNTPSLRVELAVAIAMLLLIAGCRRLGSPRIVVFTGLVFSTVALAMLLGARVGGPSSSLILYLVTASPDRVQATERMLSDAPMLGTGAGSFATLSHLYTGQVSSQAAVAPSKLALLIVEIGWPAVLIIAIGLGFILVQTFLGSIRRGRDAAYPMTTFALIVFLILSSLSESDTTTSIIPTLVAAQAGLGLVQTLGRRQKSSDLPDVS